MFTGIVSEKGSIRRIRRGAVMDIDVVAPGTTSDLDVGDSVAINGVCLTATKVRKRWFRVQAMGETLDRTDLGDLGVGDEVNLEPAARFTDRIGGHLVQGHVDGVAEVVRVDDDGGSRRVTLRADRALLRYMVPKGSVTLDGVSLTLTDVNGDAFEVALIPHTLQVTTFAEIGPGDRVNVEVDVVARYIERLLSPSTTGET